MDQQIARWSLKNNFLPLSYRQGLALAREFKTLAGSGQVYLRAMSETPSSIGMADEPMTDEKLLSLMRDAEKAATFFETDAPENLTEDVWRRAAYIDLSITSETTHGHAEFKGARPKQASFSLVAPSAADAAQAMIHNHLLMGSGKGSNAERNCHGACSLG